MWRPAELQVEPPHATAVDVVAGAHRGDPRNRGHLEFMEDPVASAQALVVGVSRYHQVPSLPPNQDVAGVRDVLASPKYCAYPPERVTVLAEDQATRAGILAAVDRLCSSADAEGSRTWFYFSGHGGQADDGAAYVLPVDARRGEYPTTAISVRELSSQLARCRGEVTVVLDCCYAAGMAGFGDAFRGDIQSRGRVVLAASHEGGYAYAAPDAPYGLFTGHLIEGLQGKASTDGLGVTVQQLYHYVQRLVKSSSDRAQRPAFIAHVEEFYSLTRYPQPVARSTVFEKDVFISYDRGDPAVKRWVSQTFVPRLEGAGRSVWHHDPVGGGVFDDAPIRQSKYVVVLLTESYFRNQLEEFKGMMAILQAVESRTPRFIPILRESCNAPLAVRSFVGLDMRDENEMALGDEMRRLLERLAREPHER
jgi:hypothetical protein